jgi:LysM repeat protein
MLTLLGQLQPNWDLSNLKTRVEVQANALVRKIVVDSLNKDTLITPPVEILYHRVKKGESFYSIAKRYKLTIDALVRRNKRLKTKALQVGDRIRIN